MKYKMGIRELEYPSEAPDALGELRDCNDLLGDVEALQRRMAEDGYLYVRNLIDRDKVLTAREHILRHMAEQDAFAPDTPVLEGVMPKGGPSVGMMGRSGVAHDEVVKATLEADELFDFFSRYFDEPVTTFDYKWLRGVGNEEFTGAHYDIVYMGRGSERLHTTWIPMGDIPIEQGTLAMCVGSHCDESFAKLRETYGRSDVDRDFIEGWFTSDPLEITEKFGGKWRTTNFRAGDVMIFGMHSLHASTTNTTNRFRLSCDVRYQPAGDPLDERWGGDNPVGHYAWLSRPRVPIEESKAAWGL